MDLEAVGTKKITLEGNIGAISDSNTSVMMTIDDIARDAEAAKNSALIEDYFTVNDSQINIRSENNLYTIDAFCIAATSVLEFELAFN